MVLGIIWQVYFVLIAVNKEASCFSLPFIINFGHWYNSHLVSLSQDLLLGKLAGVTGHQLSRGHLDHVVIHRLHAADHQLLLLEGDLAGHVPDEVLRDAELGGDVLGGDQAPGHRQLDVGPDVGRALARRAVNLPAGLDMRKC